MRNILVDLARAQGAKKRGADFELVALDEILSKLDTPPGLDLATVLTIDEDL